MQPKSTSMRLFHLRDLMDHREAASSSTQKAYPCLNEQGSSFLRVLVVGEDLFKHQPADLEPMSKERETFVCFFISALLQ